MPVGCVRRNRRDVFADRICELIACAFDGSPAKQPDTLRVPIGRAHAVDGGVNGIPVAVVAVAVYFPQLQDLISLRTIEQQVTVIRRSGMARLVVSHGGSMIGRTSEYLQGSLGKPDGVVRLGYEVER